jgi:hypothetical protein
MDLTIRDRFLELWEQFFDGAELPLCFQYADAPGPLVPLPPPKGHVCVIGQLARVRRGESLCFGRESLGCFGGKRCLGFGASESMPNFEYFLSYGIPGQVEGERYKKSPEIVRGAMAQMTQFEAPTPYIVFKRWDRLEKGDEPEAVIFYAKPDVLSGLFTLTGYAETERDAVIAPFGAGCSTIVQYPYLEGRSPRPRGVLGTFDVSARPFVPAETLSFAVPMGKFLTMVADMEESFLITKSWKMVRRRLAGEGKT